MTVNKSGNHNPIDYVAEVDFAVVGVGTMGSMALWQLSELAPEGTSILGIEQFGRLHTRGSYSGESRLFRVALKEGGDFIEFAQRARELWLDLNEKSGRDVFLPIGALSIGPSDYQTMMSTQKVIEEFDLDHSYLDSEELRERFPQFEVAKQDIGIYDPQGGGIRPEVAVASATELALDNGAKLWTHTKVLGIDRLADGGAVLRTSRGSVLAHNLILTLGSWAGELIPEAKDVVRVKPIPLTWFMPRTPELFSPENLPIFLYDKPQPDGSSFHIYGAPSIDGYTVKFSTNAFFVDTVDHPDQVPSTVREPALNAFSQRVAEVIPDFFPDVARLSMHHDGFTEDGHAIIDVLPEHSLTMAVGMSGTGMKFAPYFGRLAATLALSKDPSRRPEFFSVATHRP
nr:N-methyl-L-tryptophan oxidase [Corynebacterium sp. UBA5992]